MTCPTCGTTDYARCDRRPTPCRRVRVVDDPTDIGRIVGREVHWPDGHADLLTRDGRQLLADELPVERV